jgi:oligoendopeptidase F
MSFTKTVSVVAALASIFSVGLASWKISEDIKNEQTAPLEQKIQELEKKLEKPAQPVEQVAQPQVQTVQQPIILPPVAPPPPVPPEQPTNP